MNADLSWCAFMCLKHLIKIPLMTCTKQFCPVWSVQSDENISEKDDLLFFSNFEVRFEFASFSIIPTSCIITGYNNSVSPMIG